MAKVSRIVMGIDPGLANTVGGLVYWPTGIEWMVTLGVIGLAAALLCFGLDRICKK